MRPTIAAAVISALVAVLAMNTTTPLGLAPRTAQAVVTSAGAVHEQQQPAYTPPPIRWRPCAYPSLRAAGARCGYLTVPLDYAHPQGQKIELGVSRVEHRPGTTYQGAMLTNPGGPGGSGVVLSTLGSAVPDHAGDGYDWIGFDPRGVGTSRPALTCDPTYFHPDRPSYVPQSKHDVRIWVQRSQRYARACASARARRLLAHVRTVDTVRDMDSLRIALGASRINFYGYSYGTYLGQVYATTYPDRVGRFVLDSNVDPRSSWYRDTVLPTAAFNRNIDVYFRWLAAHDGRFHLGRDWRAIRRGYYHELRVLDQHPAGGQLGPDELTDAMEAAGYYVVFWDQIGRAYAALLHRGSAAGLLRVYRAQDQVGNDNLYAMFLATSCTDAPSRSLKAQLPETRRIYRRYPFLAWGGTWFGAPCAFWPVPPRRPPAVDGRAVTQPILLIDETRDAATPFSGDLEVRRRFPSARLVAGVGGTMHGVSLMGDACIDGAVAAYLKSGEVPARQPGNRPDKLCPALAPR